MKTQHLVIAALTLATDLACFAQTDAAQSSGTATQPGAAPSGTTGASTSRNATITPAPPGGMGGFGGVGVAAPPPARTPGGAPPPAQTGYGGSGFGGGYGGASAPALRSPDNTFSQRLQAIVARAGGEPGGSGEPLLVLCSETEPEARDRLHEDMLVMAHILQKAAGTSGPGYAGRAMGVDLVFAPGWDPGRDLYLEGYGAVFLVRVPFPLLAPPTKTEGGADQASTDSDWERAKRELHGQPPEPAVVGPATEPYREDRVTQLRNAILEALKNAINVRELKADESVTVCVIGPTGFGAPAPQPMTPWRVLRGPEGAKLEPGAPRRPTETMLTIRASKADIDSFAKGQSDLETFRKRAKISSYGA